MVLCGNVNQKQIGSSNREEEPVLVINYTSSSEDNERRIRHFKLYRAALKGDWNTAERIYEEDKDYIAAKLSKERDTALHIAAAARHTGFVKKLLEQIQMEDLTIKNNVGNTAFFLAAASGEVDIAEAIMEKHGDLVMIRGKDDMLPLHKAALMGNEEMVEYLYQATGYNIRIMIMISSNSLSV
ncbi:ankyrin repeat domain-containing protein 16-like [Pistacia vera]|uniref:ankyrin repeat domain-containing protein 16-like n=1 Tax=Pistacia vera TaxID=55513 RepID=UPI0012637A25|nr:ankyrin repeat domain-containing protein 16-like [Pistacia vera]